MENEKQPTAQVVLRGDHQVNALKRLRYLRTRNGGMPTARELIAALVDEELARFDKKTNRSKF